jgi:hypothetical protein
LHNASRVLCRKLNNIGAFVLKMVQRPTQCRLEERFITQPFGAAVLNKLPIMDREHEFVLDPNLNRNANVPRRRQRAANTKDRSVRGFGEVAAFKRDEGIDAESKLMALLVVTVVISRLRIHIVTTAMR